MAHQMQIVPELNSYELRKSALPIYSPEEKGFLDKFAPCYTGIGSIKDWKDDPAVNLENMLNLYKGMVANDCILMREMNLSESVEAKQKALGPIIRAYLGREPYLLGIPVTDLHQLKIDCLDAMLLGSEELEPRKIKRGKSTNPQAELVYGMPKVREAVERVTDILGDHPMIVYGSLKNDVDVAVSLPELTLDTYRKLCNIHEAAFPIDIFIVPEGYEQGTEAYDPHVMSAPENSVVVNRSWNFYDFPKEHRRKTGLHHLAQQLITLRESLTSEQFDRVKAIPGLTRSRLKIPGFMRKKAEALLGLPLQMAVGLPIIDYSDKESVHQALIGANMHAHDILFGYLSKESQAIDYSTALKAASPQLTSCLPEYKAPIFRKRGHQKQCRQALGKR